MKFGKRELQFILVLLGLVLVGCTYYFGYMKITEETTRIEERNRILKGQADAYEILYHKVENYKGEKDRMAAAIPDYESEYLYGLSTSDEIMYVARMEGAQKDESLQVSYLNMSQAMSMPYTPEVEVDPAFASGAISMPSVPDDGIMVVKYTIDYGCAVSYSGFKEMVEYIKAIGGKKNINSVSLSFDSTNGLLNGTLSVDFYVLTGTDNQYNPFPIPKVDLGVENIFGTIQIMPEEAEPEEEGPEAAD